MDQSVGWLVEGTDLLNMQFRSASEKYIRGVLV